MDRKRPHQSSSLQYSAHEDDAADSSPSNSSPSSSNTQSSSSASKAANMMRKKLGFLGKKRSSIERARKRPSSRREGEEQNVSAGALKSSKEEEDVLCVDKFGCTVESIVTIQDQAVNNGRSGSTDGRPPNDYIATRHLMKQFVRQGLPDPIGRQRAWAVMTGVDTIMLKREGGYDSFVGRASREGTQQTQECLIGGQQTHWVSSSVVSTFTAVNSNCVF